MCMVTKEQIKELVKSYVLRMFQGMLFWVPVKRNRVMVHVHARRGFTCNPKYVVKKLRERYGGRLEIIWTTFYPDSCGELKALGVRVVTANSRENIRAYFRTRVYVTNDAFPSWALRRPNQRWVNTWHGGMNYKHIGYEYLPPMNALERRLFRIKNRTPDVYLSGSRFFTENTSACFRMDPAVFVPTGLPRNDLFFEKGGGRKEEIRAYFDVAGDTKIALYAPTFRMDLASQSSGMDFERLRHSLSCRFGGKWAIFFRNHCFVGEQSGDLPHVADVSAYADMQELLLAADVLVSDYSSCMWDFCLTGRPCFVLAKDLANYEREDRGFACPVEKWPFTVARDMEQLEQNILAFDAAGYAKRITAHLEEMGSYDLGDASRQAARIIWDFCGIEAGSITKG